MANTKNDDLLRSVLIKQKYHLVGSNSAVKKCKWLHESLLKDRVCYKQKFFGIESHRCLQMTPALFQCTQRCLWCWRTMPEDLGIENYKNISARIDSPQEIIGGCIREQKRILSGYKDLVYKGKINPRKFSEALNPNNAAISLAGEPTIYPFLGELISEFKRMSFTVFLVTNGTMPEMLRHLEEEPTQLYVTVSAPTAEIYQTATRPIIERGFEKLKETLSMLNSFSCPTVFRITSAKGINMTRPEEYARLSLIANPTYIEVKGVMAVGYGRRIGRIGFDNMPSMAEIEDFAQRISESTGYEMIAKDDDSNVLLLSRLKTTTKFSLG